MSSVSLNDVRVSVLIRYVRIKLNYKLYFRVDIALDSISYIPGVAELVDASDSRSDDIRVVQVQVLSPVNLFSHILQKNFHFISPGMIELLHNFFSGLVLLKNSVLVMKDHVGEVDNGG